MTIKECIDIVDNAKPNQYSIRDKVMWLSFIDEIIINDVLKTHEGYDGRYDDFSGYTEEKLSIPLIVPSPYDRLYTAYLKMKIDGENGETTRYNNSAALFNSYMMEYRKFYNKTHMPLDITKPKAKPSKNDSTNVSDAVYENLKRELYALLSEDFAEATSKDKLYSIVNEYAINNVEMLKGKDGRDGIDGKDGINGKDGVNGKDGASIKGEKGDKGDKGDTGPQGAPGYTPQKGIDYFDGKDAVTDQTYSPKSRNAQSGIAVEEAISGLRTSNGTVVSQNADFAEVAEWADGNPNNEDRTGYFVCANVPVNGIVMKKATSIDDVKGVSILAPAFAGNFTKDKLDSNGNLLPKYSYVAIIGFVPVRDNGTCEVGGRCMPDDNGCAIPSSNSMGYQVVNRIDENRVLIIIEPNGDMVQRVKTKIVELQDKVDKKVDPEDIAWKTLLDVTLTEEHPVADDVLLEISDPTALANAKRIRIFALFPVATEYAANKVWTTVSICDKNQSSYNFAVVSGYSVKSAANTEWFVMANIDISDIGFTTKNSSGGYTPWPRTYHSVGQLANPWYVAPANSNVNAKHITGGYPSDRMATRPPYLYVKNTEGLAPLKAGARFVVEVQV